MIQKISDVDFVARITAQQRKKEYIVRPLNITVELEETLLLILTSNFCKWNFFSQAPSFTNLVVKPRLSAIYVGVLQQKVFSYFGLKPV